MWDVVVVGGGAAGLLAAARAAECGRRTLLLEKNRRPGIKILMSGGTRCNITHATDARGIITAFGAQGPFLHSALAALGPSALVELVEAEGVQTKVEETGKIFPVSDRASDVLEALLRRLRRSGCQLATEEPLQQLLRHGDRFALQTSKRHLETTRVIIATGGRSYPGSGTTGDAYSWLADVGHTICTPRPALTPITSNLAWVQQLKGVTIPDAQVGVLRRQREADAPGRQQRAGVLAERRGSFLFTHFGLSGPSVLDVSRAVTAEPDPRQLDLQCDFLPTLTTGQFEQWFQQEAAGAGKKRVGTALAQHLPRRLVETLLQQAGLSDQQRLAELSKEKRRALIGLVKQNRIPISGTRGFKKAEVTAGGVALDEVDSRCMQSKLVPGLFLCGEVLDLDGPIGGYNFQAAFSTGWLAGSSV